MPAYQRRYRIGEVAEQTGLPVYLLRQWEEKVPYIRAKRDRAKRRYYTEDEIERIKRLKFLVRHEKLTLDGAKLRLGQELHGEGRPRTRREMIDILDRIEDEVRAMLDLIDGL